MFFRELASVLETPGDPDMAAMDAMDDRYGVGGQLGQMDWIPDLAQRYGLNSPL